MVGITTEAAPPVPPVDSKQIADAAKAVGRLIAAGLLGKKGGGK